MTREEVRFIATAADWADSAHADLAFYRDAYDGWVAKVAMSDARGIFSAEVTIIPRRGAKNGEPPEPLPVYEARISKALSTACAKARARRQQMPRSPRL